MQSISQIKSEIKVQKVEAIRNNILSYIQVDPSILVLYAANYSLLLVKHLLSMRIETGQGQRSRRAPRCSRLLDARVFTGCARDFGNPHVNFAFSPAYGARAKSDQPLDQPSSRLKELQPHLRKWPIATKAFVRLSGWSRRSRISN
jgi:hypothetical protein